MTKKIYVLGGGTVYHVRPHLAISAPAYGKVARQIMWYLKREVEDTDYQPILALTKMANPNRELREEYLGETNNDVAAYLEQIVGDPDTKMIFLSTALCDFEGMILGDGDKLTASGKGEPRLKTKDGSAKMFLKPADKLIGQIRKQRKDIFLVGFKTTAGANETDQFNAGLELLKKNSCNLVLANDVQTGLNMIVAPELAQYEVTRERNDAIQQLVTMALSRSGNTFSRTKIETGDLVKWTSPEVPEVLRKVVDACVEMGTYKPFNDVTVGHFGYKAGPNNLVSSRRKQNFNRPECRDLVKVSFEANKQTAYGAKPSAGARSQYEVLSRYDDLKCIVHFHCPARPDSVVPVRSQREFECGSHQCGKNTADGMKRFNSDLAAVMLDKHGPNVVFSDKADPEMVIDFIKANFDLARSTR